MTIKIKVGKRALAIVDDEFEMLAQYKWNLIATGRNKYAKMMFSRNKKVYCISMHSFVVDILTFGASQKRIIDHINGNGLDNRVENLRLCTCSQNFQNSRKRQNCSSIYKGVYYDKGSQKWRAMICPPYNNSSKHIGLFNNEDEAGRAYDAKALELFGEFAKLNFPGTGGITQNKTLITCEMLRVAHR